MTKKEKWSQGVHISIIELNTINEWLISDLMMQARSIKITVSNNTSGIGPTVNAYALDDSGEVIASKNVTDYEGW